MTLGRVKHSVILILSRLIANAVQFLCFFVGILGNITYTYRLVTYDFAFNNSPGCHSVIQFSCIGDRAKVLKGDHDRRLVLRRHHLPNLRIDMDAVSTSKKTTA